MKKFIFAALFCLAGYVAYSQHQLVKLWETDTLKVPESVMYDAANQVLYVANIEGTEPWAKDGKGSIAKVGLDGKIIAAEWVTGFNAAKGMGLFKDQLYVADIDRVHMIDIQKGMISRTMTVEGAAGLNDIAIDSKGMIYVSDSRGKKIYVINEWKASVFKDSLRGPNGLMIHEDELYVLDQGGLYKFNADKSMTKLADGMEGGTDGVENVQEKEFIVSCWAGVIYYVNGDGTKEKLLDSRDKKINTADIGYDAKKRIVYVPTFWKNSVIAYQLK
jgi:sugar lactone lactonase YvrE